MRKVRGAAGQGKNTTLSNHQERKIVFGGAINLTMEKK